MGLLGKVIGTGASMIGAGAAAMGKKIEDAFINQERKNLQYLSKYPYKYKYLIREVKTITDDMVYAKKLGLDKDFFCIYTSSNEPCYFAFGSGEKRKKGYILSDLAGNEIVCIEVSKSLLNSKTVHCKVGFESWSFELNSRVSFDKRKYEMSSEDYDISVNEEGTEIKLKCKKNRLGQLNKIPSDLGMKWGEYVVGCNEEKNELLLIIFGVCVGIASIRSENLLEDD